MLATLIAILIAIIWGWHPIPQQVDATSLAMIMAITAIPFLVIFPLGIMWAWLPLQKAEQNATPRILEMFRKDHHIFLSGTCILLFPLLTFAFAGDILYLHLINKTWLMPIWIILLGLTIDALRHYVWRVIRYLNPFSVVSLFTQQAEIAIQKDQEIDLCQWIDGLAEISIKGIQRHGSAIPNLALNQQNEIAKLFLVASRSIAHENKKTQANVKGLPDKVSFIMFYIYQRIDMIFNQALSRHIETTCSHVVTVLGKIAISAANCDITLASAPLRFIGKCAIRAQEEGFEETAMTASCTLYGVGKVILDDIDIRYVEIKDPFLSIINGMETLAKGTFKRDKNTNLTLLIQPFKDLKALFDTPKAKDHQDTPIILQNIDRVIGEFDALQIVMNTIPPLPTESRT